MNFSAFTSFLLALAFVGNAGCGMLGDREESTEPMSLASSQAGCLNDFDQQIKDYFEGRTTLEQWNSNWDCVDRSLEMFSNHVRGSRRDGYTQGDLHALVSKFLISNRPFPKTLIESVFDLKSTLLGGSTIVLTHSEMDQLREFLSTLRAELGSLLPSIWEARKLLESQSLSEEESEGALRFARKLSESAKRVGLSLSRTYGSPLSIRKAERFVDEVSEVFGWQDLSRYLPVIFSAKAAFSGGANDRVDPSEWPRSLEMAGWLGASAMIWSGRKPESFESDEDSENLMRQTLLPLAFFRKGPIALTEIYRMIRDIPAEFIDFDRERLIESIPSAVELVTGRVQHSLDPSELEGIVEISTHSMLPALRLARLAAKKSKYPDVGATLRSIRREFRVLRPSLMEILGRHKNTMSMGVLDRVLDRLPLDWSKLKPASVKKLMRRINTRLLLAPSGEKLTKRGVETGLTVFDDWVETDAKLEQLYAEDGPGTEGLSPARFLQLADRKLKETPKPEHFQILRLIDIARRPHPTFNGSDPQITFSPDRRLSLPHMRRMVWMRIAVERLMKGYGSIGEGTGASLEDLQALFDDFSEMGLELKVLQPDFARYTGKRFIEANLFTPSGNGDEVFDRAEATEYFSLMISSKELGRRILSELSPICADTSLGQDPLGWTWLEIDCFRREFRARLETYWDYFPALWGLWSSLPAHERDWWWMTIESGARQCGATSRPIASRDIEAMSGLFHFVESVFAKFDAGWDGVLGNSDAADAFPRFRPVLARLAKRPPENEGFLYGIFTFLLQKGRLPGNGQTGKWGQFTTGVEFVTWQAGKPFWKIRADRRRVYDILAMIGEALKPEGDDPCARE